MAVSPVPSPPPPPPSRALGALPRALMDGTPLEYTVQYSYIMYPFMCKVSYYTSTNVLSKVRNYVLTEQYRNHYEIGNFIH